MTLKEARKIQKQREQKAVFIFLFSLAAAGIITYLLLEFTNIFELSSVFYLIPLTIIALAVKKSRVYLMLTAREFKGKVVYHNVYVVQDQRIKGKLSYTTVNGLEVEMIIENDHGSKTKILPAIPAISDISEGCTVTLLRFIDQPIIIKENN
jgi:hypothetical protein